MQQGPPITPEVTTCCHENDKPNGMDGFPNSGVLVQHLHYHFEAYFEDVSNNLTPKPGFYHAPKPTLRFTEQHGLHQVHQVCADFWCAAI